MDQSTNSRVGGIQQETKNVNWYWHFSNEHANYGPYDSKEKAVSFAVEACHNNEKPGFVTYQRIDGLEVNNQVHEVIHKSPEVQGKRDGSSGAENRSRLLYSRRKFVTEYEHGYLEGASERVRRTTQLRRHGR